MITSVGEITDIGVTTVMNAIPGAKYFAKFGYGVVGATFSTVFSPGIDPGLYQYLPFAKKLALASTDPDDTLGGLGGNQILISGICEDLCEYSEVIDLNGQTPVNTSLEYLRIFRMVNISKSGNDCQGQIYAGAFDDTWVAGEPTNILAHINDGYNQTQMALYTVPDGYTLLIMNVVVCSGNKDVEFGVFVRQNIQLNEVDNSVFTIAINWLTVQSTLAIDISKNPFVFPSKSEFEFRAKTLTATTPVTANVSGVLIPNKYFK